MRSSQPIINGDWATLAGPLTIDVGRRPLAHQRWAIFKTAGPMEKSTEGAGAYDVSEDEEGVIRGSYTTNEMHVGDRQLIRMMLALPDLVLQRGEYIYM